MKMAVPESYDSGPQYVDKEGRYHVQVLEVNEGVNGKGSPFDGFHLKLGIVEGEHEDQIGRSIDISVFNPSGRSEKADEISQRLQTNFVIACNLFDPGAVKAGQEVEIDITKALHQQLIVHLAYGKEKDGKRYLQFHYSDVFHIDDPDVNSVKKDAKMLAILPAQLRKKPEFFSYKAKKKPEAKKEMASAGASKSDQWGDL